MSMIKDVIARAELAMMGVVVPINNYSEADLMTQYIYKTARNREKEFDSEKQVNKYNASKTKNEIVGLVAYCVYDMCIVAYVLRNKSRGDYKIVPFEYNTENYFYSLCWAENLDQPEFSELGDVCFKKVGETYKFAG